jgi:hypothetical protein
MFKSIVTLFGCGILALVGCQQTPILAPKHQGWGLTSQLEAAPLYSGVASKSLNRLGAFKSAQTVRPLLLPKAHQGRSQPSASAPSDGYTLTFFDLNGVSFAYATHVTQANVPLEPNSLLARDTQTAAPEDPKQWQDATYITGANTRRTPLGSYHHGFPILHGLFGEASKTKGFDVNTVAQLVMPRSNMYWAKTSDGRYFDLIALEWVDSNTFQRLKDEYNQLVEKLDGDQKFAAEATKQWNAVAENLKVSASACVTDCIQTNALRPQTIEMAPGYCRPVWFLWWIVGTECDSSAHHGYLDSSVNFPEFQDNNQYQYLNAATGCGPTMLANMMWWWEKYTTHTNIMRPANTDPNLWWQDKFYTTQVELIADTGARVVGSQREAYGGEVSEGLEKYLLRNKPTLKSQAVMGWGATEASRMHQALYTQFANNRVVGVGFYVLLQGGHFGIAKNFTKVPFTGNLIVNYYNPPASLYNNMNLSDFWAGSSVHWIETR